MKRLFTTGGIPPKAYNVVLSKELGTDWLNWLPETLYEEIERAWGVRPNEAISDKINAYKTFLTTDVFYHDAAAFEHIVLAVNDSGVDPEQLTLCSPDELAYAFLVLGPFDTKKFEREIIGYIRVCCENAGLLKYPTALAFAQPEYKSPTLKAALLKIEPKFKEGDDTDIVVQQSNRLHQINAQLLERLAAYRAEVLEDSE